MTVERMIELLEIEKECVLRNASEECNRYCAGCDLLQDDTELHEMYTEALALLKVQEPVSVQKKHMEMVGLRTWEWVCGNCGQTVLFSAKFCPWCGRAVKWDA